MKKSKLDFFLIWNFAFMELFTIAMIVIFLVKGYVPDTLITMAFPYFIGENGFCAIVKSVDDIREMRRQQLEDRAYTEALNARYNGTNGCGSDNGNDCVEQPEQLPTEETVKEN